MLKLDVKNVTYLKVAKKMNLKSSHLKKRNIETVW